MKPIIYSSADAGAPQLSASAGTMNAVIKSCLVTGYGTKSAAGWQTVYEDLAAKKLAIRSTNPKSIKSALLLSDTKSYDVDITAYNDWDNLGNVGIGSFGVGIFPKVLGSNAMPKWAVIATDNFFYLWVQHSAANVNYGIISGFGDALPVGLNNDVSVLLTKGDGNGNGEFILKTSSGEQSRMPRVPMRNGANGFGDADSTADTYVSDIRVFSRCVMYSLIDSSWQPKFELQGLLMPHTQKLYKATDPFVFELANQTPYVNPLIALHQPFQGNFWLHTDDWGL